jgi:dipeptidyl aminopeptidase/acylaminoacyl peptidase
MTATPTDQEASAAVTVHPRQAITLPTQLATSVQVTGVTSLTNLVANALPVAAELSPDGKMVAWIVPTTARKEASLCLANIADGGQNCYAAAGFEGMPYRLVWSPDGRWIAFSEDPAAQAMESDIWLFDVAHRTLSNRTDDSVQGRYADATDDFTLDYLPMWDPASGLLYFWRSTPDQEGRLSLDLMRLDPNAAGKAELVRSFGLSLGDGLVRFGWQRFYLQGPSTIAPDGSRLAVLIAPAQEMDLSAKHALWLIDLENPQAPPQQLATSLSWQSGLPQWSNQPAIGRGLQWTADGKGIVVAALSSDLRLPLLIPYYVAVASGKVTPIVNFSDSSDRESFFRMDPATLHAPRMDVPWTVAMAPNANVLLLVTDLAGGMRIWAAPLPPNGAAPAMVSEHLSPGFEAWTRSSGSANGMVLVYGMLMKLTPN